MSDLGTLAIGYCIQHQSCLVHCVDKIAPKYFEGLERHVYRAICEYFKQYRKCITRTVLEETLDGFGIDAGEVGRATSLFARASNIKADLNEFSYRLDQFKKEYLQRTMLKVVEGEIDEEGNVQNSLSEIIQQDPYKAYEIIRRQISLEVEATQNDNAHRGDAASDVEELHKNYYVVKANPEKAYGIRTGYRLIDEETLGMKRGQLWVIGGVSAAGKSIFLLNVAVNVFKAKEKYNILLLSLEMSKESYWERFVSCYGEIPEKGVIKAALSKEDEEKYDEMVKELNAEKAKGHYFHIADIPSTSALTVEAEIERIIAECSFKPDVVFVDYLDIMRAIDKRASDWLEQGAKAEELRRVAREHQIPIVTAAQLNKDKDKGTGLKRIARSKIIGDTADVFLQIMEKTNEEEAAQNSGLLLPDNIMKIFFGKIRKGQMDYCIELWKDLANMRIKNKDDKSVLEKELEALNLIGIPTEVDPIDIEANVLRPLPPAVDSGQDQKAIDSGDFFNV